MTSAISEQTQDVQELADRLGREFESVIRRASEQTGQRGSRGYQSGGTRSALMEEVPEAETQERFLPVLAALLPTVVSAVPPILEAVRQQNRDIIPQARDMEQMERDFLSALGVITPKLVQSLPGLISSLQAGSRDLPQDEYEANARFLGALGQVLLPIAVDAGMQLAKTHLGGRRDLGVEPTDPEIAMRFIGPVAGKLITNCFPQVPKLIGMFGGRR